MKKNIMLFIVLALVLTSCNLPQYVTTYRSTESRDFEPRQGVVITPLLADIKMISQSSVCDSITYPIFVASISANAIDFWTSEYKKQTLSFMLKKYNADAIVASLTEISTTPDGRMKVLITGYPVKYTNFRLATANDVWMKTLYEIIDRNASNASNVAPTQNTVLIK